jgi:hypothetical protein
VDCLRLDEVVLVEGGRGRVEDSTLSYVVVHRWDDRRLILPKSYFHRQAFPELARTEAALLDAVEFDVTRPVSIHCSTPTSCTRYLEPTDFALVTADVASMFRAAIERAGMRLQVDPAGLSRPIQVDPEMWVRIVANGTTFTVQVPMSTASRETEAGGHP